MHFFAIYYHKFLLYLIKKRKSIIDGMDDSEVIRAINSGGGIGMGRNGEKKMSPTSQVRSASFVFTLKNRVGGLARALKVLQVKVFLFYFVSFSN